MKLSHEKLIKNLLLLVAALFLATSSWAQKYEYDKAGRLVKVTYQSGKKIYYYYDKAGNIVSVREIKKSRREIKAQNKSDSLRAS